MAIKSDLYMKAALKEAQKAFQQDEVPIGAIIVDREGNVIAKAHNKSEQHDCTEHAEILAIKKACKKLKSNRLRGCDMYVTLEPCTMCSGAISFARIENLYIGAMDAKGGGTTFYQQKTCHHKPKIHILNDHLLSQILKDFFKAKRK